MKELFEVTPEQSLEWKARETQRLADGTYTLLPENWRYSPWFCDTSQPMIIYPDGNRWHPPRYPDHFAHISIDKVATIAFTESEQKGVRDRQTRINPGKYLTRYFSGFLSAHDIRDLATRMGADYNDDAELAFAVTADEIEHVYVSGPRSCMAYNVDDFESEVHPVRVYAGFDLQLAYLKRNGGITARALVWPEKKIYGRLYGDQVRLSTMLQTKGYSGGSLGGARITKLKDDGDYVIPYLDYLAGAVDKGTHLELVAERDGRRLCCTGDNQNGLSRSRGATCYNCSEEIDGDDSLSYDGDNYCQCCFDNRYFYCERSGDACSRDEAVEVRTRRRNDGSYRTADWGRGTADCYAFFCDRDEVYYSDGFTPVEVGSEMWGPEAVERDAVQIDGVWYDKDNAPEADETPARAYSPTVVQPNQLEAPLGQVGLHIRHEPENTPFCYRLYNGNQWINGWFTEAMAVEGMARHQVALAAREARIIITNDA